VVGQARRALFRRRGGEPGHTSCGPRRRADQKAALTNATVYSPQPFHLYNRANRKIRTFPASSSSLLNLPTELQDEIISHLDIGTVFCLATCSQSLFYLCRTRILSLLKSQCGQLAGTSLICIGHYLELDDFPPGMTWQSAMEPKMAALRKQLDDDGEDGRGSLYDVADHFSVLAQPSGSFVTKSMSAAQLSAFRISITKLPRTNQKDLNLLLDFDHRRFYPNSPDWILRNLTTKEYVPRSVVAFHENDTGPFAARGVGLGDALLTRICWSSDPSCALRAAWSMDPAVVQRAWDMTRGAWAGHRFDITLLDAVEGKEEHGWTDVSQSVVEELSGVWEGDYGAGWRLRYTGEKSAADNEPFTPAVRFPFQQHLFFPYAGQAASYAIART
jgi:hypothetical protein